jgi:large subunit ribosomal protein L30
MATKTAKSGGSMLKITLHAGLVHKMESQRKVVRALGLRKQGSAVVHADTPTIRGMVRKVEHMVTVEPTTEPSTSKIQKKKAAK